MDKIAQQAVLDQLRDALARRRRVHMSYYVPGRDEATERDVDPMRLLIVEGRTYLEGWCRRAEAVRLFRLDRVLALDVLDVAAEVPADAEPKDVDQGLFRPSAEDLNVIIDLAPLGRWVAEYYPCDAVEELGDGRLRVTLRTPDTRLGPAAGPAAGGERPDRGPGWPGCPGPGGCVGRAGAVLLIAARDWPLPGWEGGLCG